MIGLPTRSNDRGIQGKGDEMDPKSLIQSHLIFNHLTRTTKYTFLHHISNGFALNGLYDGRGRGYIVVFVSFLSLKTLHPPNQITNVGINVLSCNVLIYIIMCLKSTHNLTNAMHVIVFTDKMMLYTLIRKCPSL